jgi:hypothetical protein
MSSSGMWRRVALVIIDVSEERVASIFRVVQCGSVCYTANVVPSSLILSTLVRKATCSSGTSVLTRATRRHIPEDGILHSHHRENLEAYTALNRLGSVAET